MTEQITEPFKILIVDDERDTAESLQLAIEDALGKENLLIEIETDFDRAMQTLQGPHSYEVAVLDLFRGNVTDGDNVGKQLWHNILKTKFMPVIIYTAAECGLDPEFPTDNPIVRCFQKSSTDRKAIATHLANIKPYIEETRKVHIEFHEVVKTILLETAPYLWRAEGNSDSRPQRLLQSVRRRLAALMDLETISTGEQTQFWEQYVIPPLGDFLLTGDVLRVKEDKTDDPTSYRLVLTPSCDLVVYANGAKASEVLVARCHPLQKYWDASRMELSADKKNKDLKKRLGSLLTRPESSGFVFLPAYTSVLPSMCASLRDLELIQLGKIGASSEVTSEFVRVVSMDSPFREQLTWAYLQIAGRPGLPDRDLEKCIDENFSSFLIPS